MKICVISDMHGHLPDIEECSILFICGDVVPIDPHGIKPSVNCESKNCHKWDCQYDWVNDELCSWMEKVPAKSIVMVPGNHDIVFSHARRLIKLPCTVLVDSSVNIFGLKIYGTPWHKMYGHWPFMLPEDMLARVYDGIPPDLDVLVTHGPPYGVLDRNLGSQSLRREVLLKKPRNLFCGHIHEEYGTGRLEGTSVVNAALCDNANNLLYGPRYLWL